MPDIWFWQLIVSPHMGHLAVALARLGCKVTYVAEQRMSNDRASQGWLAPELTGVNIVYADTHETVNLLVKSASSNVVHICQGVRSNGFVSVAQRELACRDAQQWIIMETVDDSGWKGCIKRFEYARLFRSKRDNLQGLLATGHRTSDWVVKRGIPANKVYPFAYFLPEHRMFVKEAERDHGPFRFIYVGRLIPLKRIDWLINALANLSSQNYELLILGAGIEEQKLRDLATSKLGNRAKWLGLRSLSEVPSIMARADCLVLPSVHDGWGAVVSEALMVGTPAVCSDACGSADVVKASGVGGVFSRDRYDELKTRLGEQVQSGPINAFDRRRLAAWAKALGAEAGARYLMNILDHASNDGARPIPPWQS